MTNILIKNGLVFDGQGGDGQNVDLLIKEGKVAKLGPNLEAGPNAEVIDADGQWVMPGFIDLHTHYDAEIEVSPSLFESVRHGVTTVVMGSCSLSLAVGDPVDLADMFCRVEAIPRTVVKPMLEKTKDWDGPKEYIEHLHGKSLGPNVACMLGHSTIRAHAMGLERALDKKVKPTKNEMAAMDALLEEALDSGYLGLSISTLPWDKMDGEAFRSRPMPSVFARWKEYRHFANTLRKRGRLLQAVPNITTKANVFLLFALSTGILRPTLRTMVISMMDIKADRYAFRLAGVASRFVNKWLGGDFKMQALPNVFDLWADGIDLVVFEEFEAGTAALHLTEELSRSKLLTDPAYRKKFRKQWTSKFLPKAFHRNFEHSEILECPDQSVVGKSFMDVAEERGCDSIDAFLDLAAEHGKALRWYSVMGNDRPEWVERIVSHPDALIGFSDAGAHLRNMAHYNFPLRMLKLVKDADDRGEAFMTTGRCVQRLTSEIADWLGIDAGYIKTGRRADLLIVDPKGLTDQIDEIHEEVMPEFDGLSRLVRRNDSAVPAVIINGRIVSRYGERTEGFGHEPGYGQVLRAGQEVSATPVKKKDSARAA